MPARHQHDHEGLNTSTADQAGETNTTAGPTAALAEVAGGRSWARSAI